MPESSKQRRATLTTKPQAFPLLWQSLNDRQTEEKKRKTTKQALIAATEAYERREPLSMDNLLKLVSDFARLKVSHVEYDLRCEGAETADDWAQDITVSVWEALEKDRFNVTPADFYSFVHKILRHL
jgi:hypothetical protein